MKLSVCGSLLGSDAPYNLIWPHAYVCVAGTWTTKTTVKGRKGILRQDHTIIAINLTMPEKTLPPTFHSFFVTFLWASFLFPSFILPSGAEAREETFSFFLLFPSLLLLLPRLPSSAFKRDSLFFFFFGTETTTTTLSPAVIVALAAAEVMPPSALLKAMFLLLLLSLVAFCCCCCCWWFGLEKRF